MYNILYLSTEWLLQSLAGQKIQFRPVKKISKDVQYTYMLLIIEVEKQREGKIQQPGLIHKNTS